MEGISDGFMNDGCFVCGLLWPGTFPCPRCRGRADYAAARMMDPGLVRVRVARAHDAWEREGDADSLAALLTEVHLDAPESLDALDELGCDLERLRQQWRNLAPEHAPAW